MKRILFSLLLSVLCVALAAPVLADEREQAQFAIQKARTVIEKTTARSDELKVPAAELQKARTYLGNAQVALDKNTSWRGKLNPAVLPDILYWAEMAEITASTGMARLEKISHERENVRLEKAIPETEAKIKVFADKEEEIRRLRDQAGKPPSEMKSLSGELASLRTARTGLEKDIARLKAESEGLKKQVNSLTRTVEFQRSLEKLAYLSRPSNKGTTLVIPRDDLIRTAAKGSSSLAPQAALHIQRIADLVKAYPGTRLAVAVHGSGKPVRAEDQRATNAMAQMIRKAFLIAGVADSAVEASGAGTSEPLFAKGAGDANRRVEIRLIPESPTK